MLNGIIRRSAASTSVANCASTARRRDAAPVLADPKSRQLEMDARGFGDLLLVVGDCKWARPTKTVTTSRSRGRPPSGARCRSRAVSRRPCRREIAAAPDPKGRETEAELRAVASPFPTAQAFGVEDIVDPRETPPTCAASSMRRRAASGTSSGPNRSMACGHELPYREFQRTAALEWPQQIEDGGRRR
jgi:hypothetical protein